MTRRSRTARGLLLVLAALVLVSFLGAGLLFWRRHHREAVERQQRADEVGAGPKVFVAQAQVGAGQRDFTLPGDVRGFEQVTLYAKVSGYLKEIRVDKGDAVKKGQIIGILESPETEQEVLAAQADYVVKKQAADRARKLAASGVVSRQDLDNAVGALQVSRANLARVKALKEYEVIRAPFDGTVIGRYADPGALVPAATGSTQSALPLVDLANLKRVRVTMFVGQDVAPYVRVGDAATLTEDQRPERRIEAKVSRLASALDPRSRTMLTEIWLDNQEPRLYPGTFVHVTLHLRVPPVPTVPAEALVARGDSLYVAVVREDKLSFVKVEPGLNDGRTMQIQRGLKGGEWVALSVPAVLGEGARIQPVRRPERGGPGAPGVGGSGQGGPAPEGDGTPAPQERGGARPRSP